ncbi:Dynein heavy chain 8, axonemal [Platysternon megacephalum]|uniref:Dynein heavy chain 8, axonemal n=1 Tax=Platysternon megacephalum TaxID=55544 RepID=A0A4D9EWJ8_9SAUR|nr:Dynein heavy chain 8, axonemal [Platysternon megacephalum]
MRLKLQVLEQSMKDPSDSEEMSSEILLIDKLASSSAPSRRDEVVSSAPSLMPDDLKVFQELFVQIADTVESENLVISEKFHKLLNIMSASPINKGLLDLSSSLWQMPPTIPPMVK